MGSFDRITTDRNILNGQPAIRGMRISVRRLLQMLAVYPDWKQLQTEFPELELEDVQQALEYAAQNVPDEVLARDAA